MARSALTLSAMLTLGLVGCAVEEGADPLVGADWEEAAIYNGLQISEDYHDAVVSLHTVGWSVNSYHCSATYIGLNWVMTAAHCLEGFGDDLAVHFGTDSRDANSNNVYYSDRVVVNPGYLAGMAINDIGLVRLTEEPTEAAPVTPLPGGIALNSDDIGEPLDIAGFGRQENGSSGRLEHIVVDIMGVGQSAVTYNTEDGGPCFGDSGGGDFFERLGVTYVAGVNSTVSNQQCIGTATSTKVDFYTEWIELETGLDLPDIVIPGLINESYSGWLGVNGRRVHRYTSSGPGSHTFNMTSSAADQDLYLVEDNGDGTYTILARSVNQGSSDEFISLDVDHGGNFLIGIDTVSGSGTYSIDAERPE